jgi:hypothetical protein
MTTRSTNWLALAFLLFLCLAIPYGLHLEQQLRELLRLSQPSSPQALHLPEISNNTPPESEAATEPETQTDPETPERPVISAPNSYLESLLNEARRRAELDPSDAMGWLQEQDPGAPRLQAMLEVVALWASKDAEGALLWLESNAQGLARSETLKNGVTLWSAQDPAAAAAWIDGMASDGSKDVAAAALAEAWGTQDPTTTAAWIETIPLGPSRLAATQALLDTWSSADPYAATEWAAREALLGSSDALEQCLSKITESDPATAEGLVRTYLKTFPDAPLLEAYVTSLTRNDPTRAAEWLSDLPEGDPLKNNAATETLLYEWTRTDSVAASTWLSEQAPGPQRDAAIKGFIESIQAHAPDAATLWSDAISEPEARIRNLAESLESWHASDPDAAAAWIQSAELEPDLRKELNLLIAE